MPLSSRSCPCFSGSGEHRGESHLLPGHRYHEAIYQELQTLVSSESLEKVTKPVESSGPCFGDSDSGSGGTQNPSS